MMDPIRQALMTCSLFDNFPPAELEGLLDRLMVSRRSYGRDGIIAFEEDACAALGIIVQGSIRVQRLYPAGRSITIDTLQAVSSFGEALIFADDTRYPATLIANEETVVLSVTRETIVALCSQSPHFLNNFLKMLSNRILMLNRKIKSLSYQTLRQKVANYIISEYSQQKTLRLAIQLTRNELADSLGIPRPSLSRELVTMKADGLIDFDRKSISIQDLAALERCLG